MFRGIPIFVDFVDTSVAPNHEIKNSTNICHYIMY